MSNVHICREHDLNKHECDALAQELLGKLVDHFGGNYTPDGDNYLYKHATGIKAEVEPGEGKLLIDVKLGFMTRAMGPQLEAEINRVLDEHFED